MRVLSTIGATPVRLALFTAVVVWLVMRNLPRLALFVPVTVAGSSVLNQSSRTWFTGPGRSARSGCARQRAELPQWRCPCCEPRDDRDRILAGRSRGSVRVRCSGRQCARRVIAMTPAFLSRGGGFALAPAPAWIASFFSCGARAQCVSDLAPAVTVVQQHVDQFVLGCG